MKPLIGITIGDFNGIGPEIGLKALLHPSVKKICKPVLIGPWEVFEHTAHVLKLKSELEKATLTSLHGIKHPVLDSADGLGADIQFGVPTKASGRSAGIAIERAVELCVQGKIQAMVTAPVSKKALSLAGYNFPGQTEMIALLSRSQRVAMVLVSQTMRVGLVTIHTGIKDVASQLTKDKILEKISLVYDSLKRDFLVKKPRLAVLALNPHAGEQGLIGSEEEEMILPALAEANISGMLVEGPFSADAFFGAQTYKKYDALLAMYHDQGLIPLKMTSFGRGVNFSAGLQIIRTSPDHGTAYDIAGKNKASSTSMLEAISLAVRISKNRRSHD